MADDPEPARPPPPKSYVPITLLEGPTPSLPPRPGAEQGNGEPKMPPPRPQPRVSIPAHEVSQSYAVEPSEPIPMKPERQKGKKAPPKPPTPYEVAKKPVSDSKNSQPSPKPAPRRHTMAGAVRPSRPKEPSPEAKSMEFDRPKLHPPDIMTESLYASVKKTNKNKTSEFPAPNLPAPPPPYGGNAMLDKNKVEPDVEIKERSATPDYMLVGGNTDVAKSLSPQPPPPSRPSRPPAATDKGYTLSALSRSATIGPTSSTKPNKKTKGKKRAEIVIVDAKPMDGDFILSPTDKNPTSPTGLSALSQPAKPPSVPPPKRPTPPQPKKSSPATNQPPSKPGETRQTSTENRASAPQHPKNPPASRPSPPQPTKNPPAPRPSPPQPPKPGSRPSPPQPPKNQPASRPSPPHPPKNPPASRPSPPQPNKTVATPTSDQSAANVQSTEAVVADSPASAPPTKPTRAQAKSKSVPNAKRPPPPRPNKKGAVGKDASQKDGNEAPSSETAVKFKADPNLIEKLSELGPPPDEEPPEIPTEIENTAAAFLDSDSEEEEDEEKEASKPPPETSSLQASATGNKDPAPTKPSQPPPQPQARPPEIKKRELPGRPSAMPTATSNAKAASAKKAPPPAGRPPPPKLTKGQSQQQQLVEKESSVCTPGQEPFISEAEGIEGNADEKEPHDVNVADGSSGSAAPPKKVPGRRPPLPRQSSTQLGGKSSVVEKNESSVPAESEGEHKEQVISVGNVEKPPSINIKAPVVKRPPAPRPASRPRSMIVKTTPVGTGGLGELAAQSEDLAPPSSKLATMPATSEVEETKSSATVDARDNERTAPPPPPPPATATANKSPVVKRPPAPRPTSRPHSMFVKSASVSGQPVSHAATTKPKHPESEADLKKAAPAVKRPAVMRPPAPKRTPGKKGGPSLLETSVASKKDLQADSSDGGTVESAGDVSTPDTGEMASKKEDAEMIAEPEPPKPEQVKKPAAPSARRPPPPSIHKRKETKSELASAADSTDTPVSPPSIEEKEEHAQAGQDSEDTSAEVQQSMPVPSSESKAPSIPEVQGDQSLPQEVVGGSDDSSVATQYLQNDEKVLSTVAASRAKKFSIKKPSPPATAKPKSRSPTPSAAGTGTPSPPPVSPTENSEVTVNIEPVLKAPQDSQTENPSAVLLLPAPLSKKPSIKRPPPPATTRPKSRSPTPIPVTSPPSPPVEVSPSKSQEPVSSSAPQLSSTIQAPSTSPSSSNPTLSDDISNHDQEEALGMSAIDSTTLSQGSGEEKEEREHDEDKTVPVKDEQAVGSDQAAASEATGSVRSRPARLPPTAKTRPPPPRAPQRANLNKTPSSDGTDKRGKPPGSPSQARGASSTNDRSPTTRRAPSPTTRRAPSPTTRRAPSPATRRAPSPTTRRAPSLRQSRTNSKGRSTESSPRLVRAVLSEKKSPKNSPKPSRPTMPPPTQSPSLNKKSEPLSTGGSSSGSSSPPAPTFKTIRPLQPPPPVASRPVPPPPSSTTPSKPASGPPKPASGPPKPPAPTSKPGPPKPPAPASRPGPSKPPPPTAKPRALNPESSGPSKPPPPAARPEPQRKTSSSSGKGPYATPIPPSVRSDPQRKISSQGGKGPYATSTVRKTSAPSKIESSAPPSLPPRPTPGHPLYKYVCSEPHGIATAHHDANDEDELSYQAGDVIELIEKVDEHWYYATNADTGFCEGLVLATELNIIKRLPGKTTVEGFDDGPCAVATHAFEGQCLDELSFESGELIMLKSRYGDNWFRGKLINGREGIFPKNFVEVVEELPEDAYEEPPAPQKEPEASTISGPYCVATFSFTAESPGELDLAEGDQIELTRRESAEWLVGRLRGKEGTFPECFVKIVQDFPPGWDHKKSNTPSQSSSSPATVTVRVSDPETQMSTALYDFDGQDGELTFKEGDKIKVISRVNDNWVRGELGGAQGMFPADFVDSVPDSLPLVSEKTKDQVEEPTGLCKALYEFEGESKEELSFVAGETIVTLQKVTDEWLKGRIGTREGIFPIAFVEVISEIPAAPLPSQKPTQPTLSQTSKSDARKKVTQPLMDDLMPKGIALSDYQSDDISFKAGDILFLLTKEPGKNFMGENSRTGNLGTFPASYVDVQVPLP